MDDDDDANVFLQASGCADTVAGVRQGSGNDAGRIFLDYWISGDRISSNTIAAWASSFLHGGT